MVSMSMHSEPTIELNGFSTRIGEDAVPFVNRFGMFAADGMGGGASVKIMDIFDGNNSFASSDAFMEGNIFEKICNVLGCSDEDIKAKLEAYYEKSYSSMFNDTMKKLYQNPRENPFRLKKSGFFGSHALGMVLTNFLLSLEKEYPKGTNDAFEVRLHDFMEKKLPEQFKQVIECFSLTLEKVSMSKIQLFGTTLSAVFYREYDDGVDLLLFNCGDSRIYLIDDEGMKLAIKDQSCNGLITEMISLNKIEEGGPYISFNKFRVKKPFVLMCMTDGFYDAFSPLTPMHMEGSLLRGFILSCNSMEELNKKMHDWYESKTFDDCHSMSMAAFGMETYDELKAFAKRRYDNMHKEYELNALPGDILMKDYEQGMNSIKQSLSEENKKLLLDDYKDNEALREYCRARAKERISLYSNNYSELQTKYKQLTEELDEAYADLCDSVERNYSEFFNHGIRNSSDPIEIIENQNKLIQMEYSSLENSDMNIHVDKLKSFAKLLLERKVYEIHSEDLKKLGREFNSLSNSIKNELKEIENKVSNICSYADKAAGQYGKYIKNNYSVAAGKSDKVDAIINKLIKGQKDMLNHNGLSVNDVRLPEEREKLQDALDRCIDVQKRIYDIQEEIKIAEDAATQKYWEKNCIKDGMRIISPSPDDYNRPQIKFSNRVYNQLDSIINGNEELLNHKRIIAKQSEMFRNYLHVYLSYIPQDKREQIYKEGWQ